jgi:hypothetical protein
MARPAAILPFKFYITHNTPHVLYKDKLDNIIYTYNQSLFTVRLSEIHKRVLWPIAAFFDRSTDPGNE